MNAPVRARERVIMAVQGGAVDLADLRESDVGPLDLSGALAKINRFAGRTSLPWSVAAHSLLVMVLCEEEAGFGGSAAAAAAGLFHDAHEAFIGDITAPAVRFCGMQSQPVGPAVVDSCIAMAKGRIDAVIARAWGVDFLGHRRLVARADRAMLEAEMKVLLGWNGCPDMADGDEADAAMLGRAVELLRDANKLHDWLFAQRLWEEEAEQLVRSGTLTRPPAADAATTTEGET